MIEVIPSTAQYPWVQLRMSAAKIVALTESLMTSGVTYGLGAKISPLSLQAPQVKEVDCSGFVRWAIFHALAQPADFDMPDGSWDEHHLWVDRLGFKPSTWVDAHDRDNAVRIAFLEPSDSPEGVGHVMLVVNGSTCESHGHHGPDMRAWGSQPFMSKCSVYVLTAPE